MPEMNVYVLSVPWVPWSSSRQQEIQAVREFPRQVTVSPVTSGRHMAIPEVDKSLTKALREIPEKGKSENGPSLVYERSTLGVE
jgi:hypothetical protein